MMFVFYILFALLALYFAMATWAATGFTRTSYFQHDDEEKTALPFTIIVCARNEEKKIGRCLKGIIEQEYDLGKVQLIVINDASADTTTFQAQAALKDSGVKYKIITNPSQKGKKASITYAMQFAEHETIITRDADTWSRSFYWLQSISDFCSRNKPDLLIAPVALGDNQGLLWALQAIENNVLSIFTCGAAFYHKPFLCNGANLVFTKAIFSRVNGYQSHISVPSGDDVLLLEDIKKVKGKVSYIKCYDSIVNTYPCYSLKALLLQKIRWAGKFRHNDNPLNLLLSALMFAVNAGWLFTLFYGFLVPQKGVIALFFVLLKLLIDFLLLFLASRFLKNRALAWYVLPVGFIYPVYAVLVAVASVFFKAKWK